MHNSIKSFPLVPSGNSIIDADVPIKLEVVETTVVTATLAKFASITVDSSALTFTVDTRGPKEMGQHSIGVKMTDSKGSTCTYNVY